MQDAHGPGVNRARPRAARLPSWNGGCSVPKDGPSFLSRPRTPVGYSTSAAPTRQGERAAARATGGRRVSQRPSRLPRPVPTSDRKGRALPRPWHRPRQVDETCDSGAEENDPTAKPSRLPRRLSCPASGGGTGRAGRERNVTSGVGESPRRTPSAGTSTHGPQAVHAPKDARLRGDAQKSGNIQQFKGWPGRVARRRVDTCPPGQGIKNGHSMNVFRRRSDFLT